MFIAHGGEHGKEFNGKVDLAVHGSVILTTSTG